MTVYPRSRGEQIVRVKAACGGDGLSPLARGTGATDSLVTLCTRFIPASAGNSPPIRAYTVTLSVYPRSRGEQSDNSGKFISLTGLSPLARGTGKLLPLDNGILRFIPARAGNRPYPHGW